MKHSLLRLSVLIMLLAINTVVYAFEYDKLQYNIISTEDKTVEVCGNRLDQEVCVIPENVELNGVTYSVTQIGYQAFYRCKTLKKITIPNSIKHIGGYAFASSNLEQIAIPNSVEEIEGKAFSECKSLSSVSLPNGITKIAFRLFEDCTSLKTISLPNSITEIEERAFYGCTKLESVFLPNNLKTIGFYVFWGCSAIESINIPNSVIAIGDYTFSGCTNLKQITLPDELTTINSGLLRNCTKLKKIIIPPHVTNINYGAFENCQSLESIDFPSSVTSFGSSVFRGCVSLVSVILPDNITIPIYFEEFSHFFADCTNLSYVKLPNNLTKLSSCFFENCRSLETISLPSSLSVIGESAFSGCTNLKQIEIPNRVTSIKSGAFYNCNSLKNIEIPSGVEIELYHTFSGCHSLESVVLPSNVEKIGTSAFEDCKALKNINIPDDLKYIGPKAFYGCNSLTSLTIPQGVTEIGKDAFASCLELTVKMTRETALILNTSTGAISLEVPKGSTINYATSKYWNEVRKIYAIEGGKQYVPLLLTVDGEKVVNMKEGAENGIEVEEGKAVEISLIGDLAKYSFIMKGSVDISDSIKFSGSYTLYPSVYYRDNMIRTFAYQTKDVHVANSGTLVTEVGRDNIEDLLSLKVSGELNGTDILAIWKMKNLRLLDMSDATIVNGGATYYENYTTSNKTIGDYFFREKENLINVLLPKNTGTIKRRAFEGCKRLKAITIPSLVTEIGEMHFRNEVFYGCDSIESATFLCPTVFECFKGSKSLRKVIFGEKVKTIPSSAFYQCEKLESVIIPDNIEEIDRYAFGYCKKLMNVHLPNSISVIEDRVFEECTYLKHINIPPSVNKIDEGAFWKCVNIEEIELPNSIAKIGDGAFYGCSSLKSITLPPNIKSIRGAFYGCVLIKSVFIPSSIEECESAFAGCTSLQSVCFSDGFAPISLGSFSGCRNLESITIPSNATDIGAFGECEKLQTITIPQNVSKIVDGAFKGCAKLRSIYSLNPTPPILEEVKSSPNTTFEDYHYINATLYVPYGTSSIYWLHPYWEYFNNVVELDASNIEGVVNETKLKSDYMYDLNGMRVSPGSAKKGIYIKNGKKIIIK